MGLVTRLLTLPISAPLIGAWWIAQKLAETAEAELTDPARLKKRLAELEGRLLAGEIDEDQYDTEEEQILALLRPAGDRI
ncbi:MAG: gas vesicle protein GvpG [Paracoccaceae bacterium]